MSTDPSSARSAGPPPERSPAREELRTRLWRLFLDELDEHGGRMQRGLDELAATLPVAPPDTVAELFRSAHSLKGAAQAVGADTVATLCHEMEGVLAAVRDGDLAASPDLLARLGAGVDVVVVAGGRLRAGGEVTAAEVRPVLEQLAAQRPSPGQTGPEPFEGPRMAGPAVAPVAELPVPDQPARAGDGGSVRVEAAKLDELMSLAGELSTVAYRTDALVARLLDGDRRAEDADELARAGAATGRALRTLTDSFATAVRRLRTVPFADATAGLNRVVHEVCRQTGKQARVVVENADVEIDRALVAALHDVLRHLVRNAVDHGIEPAPARGRAGKPAEGTVVIRAVMRSDSVEVTVSDDGRGVDLAAVAAANGENGRGQPAELSGGALDVLFRPGFSTAARVSGVSGRGVGLDVVRTEVEAMAGSVVLETTPGAGTRVVLTLPLALSTMRAVLARVGDELVALPTSAVRTLVHVRPDTFLTLEQGRAVVLDGVTMRVVRLGDVLGWPATDRGAEEWPALVVPGTEGPALLAVDELLTEREVVVRAGSARLAGVPALLGTALLEDGTIALVMSPAGCLRLGLASTAPPVPEPAQPAAARRVLLAEDTMTTRELERSILEGAGYEVVVARDGAEAWQLLQEHPVDVLVSDVNMPRMDGIALCRAVRSAPRLSALPIVLVTSLASDEDQRRGVEAGADAYVTKSGFGREELLVTLDRLL